jgi:hypothetical protein
MAAELAAQRHTKRKISRATEAGAAIHDFAFGDK